MRTTLTELGLNENDFKVEILKLGEPEYKNPFSPLSPIRTIIAKINGVTIRCSTSVNVEMLQDLKMMHGIDVELEIENHLKSEIINFYINDIRYERKAKLQKIKEKYES